MFFCPTWTRTLMSISAKRRTKAMTPWCILGGKGWMWQPQLQSWLRQRYCWLWTFEWLGTGGRWLGLWRGYSCIIYIANYVHVIFNMGYRYNILSSRSNGITISIYHGLAVIVYCAFILFFTHYRGKMCCRTDCAVSACRTCPPSSLSPTALVLSPPSRPAPANSGPDPWCAASQRAPTPRVRKTQPISV